MKIVRLIFNGQVVGLRVTDKHDSYDVDFDVIKRLGINVRGITESVVLVPRGELLLSPEEINTGRLAKDISNDIRKIRLLFEPYLNTRPKTKASTSPSKKGTVKFKNGLAIILESISEESAEYKVLSKTYSVYLIFRTKTAISRASSILGYALDKKRTLMKFERGTSMFNVRLDSRTKQLLESEFGSPINVTADGFTLNCSNHYDDTRFSVDIIPPDFHVDYSNRELKYAHVGTTAGGEPLPQYIEGVKESFKSGYYHFVAGVRLSDVKRACYY